MKKQITVLLAALLGGAVAQAQTKYLNEWIFDRDSAGLTLSAAENTGNDGAVFEADALGVTQTDGEGGLVCSHRISGVGNLYTDGAILRADVINQADSVRYLRYDIEYDMTSEKNDSGTLMGLAFADSTSTNLAGVVIQYNSQAEPPDGIELEEIASDLEMAGTLSVVAKVDLGAQTIDVWYNLSGGNDFGTEESPSASSSITLESIEELEFRASGDIIAAGASGVRVDNIRTATTWAEIIAPIENLIDPPDLVATIVVDEALAVGLTNTVSVVIENIGGIASNVYATLSHNGGSFLSIDSVSADPLNVGYLCSISNTFTVTALTGCPDGYYQLNAQAFADEGFISEEVTAPIYVGPRISYASYSVSTTFVGAVGDLIGEVEPGETNNIIVTSVNDGAVSISRVKGELLSGGYFTVLSIPPQRGITLSPGGDYSLTYKVVCAPNTPNGRHPISIVNYTSTGQAWTNEFMVDVVATARLQTRDMTMFVAPGEIVSAPLEVLNVGNRSDTFEVTVDGGLPTTYSFEQTSGDLISFWPAEFSPETAYSGSRPDANAFEFPFYLFGIKYDTFAPKNDGSVTLKNEDGDQAVLRVYSFEDDVDVSSIRYKSDGSSVIIAWNNDADHTYIGPECQAWIHADGSIEYRYAAGIWAEGLIGISDDRYAQTITYTPGLVNYDAVVLEPSAWVTYTPKVSIGGYGSTAEALFTADSSAFPSGIGETNEFTATITWGENISTSVLVSVIFTNEIYSLDVPSDFNFGGLAGFISPKATMTITNSGNVALTYSIIDAEVETYSLRDSEFDWDHIPDYSGVIIDESLLDEVEVPIGFPFAFFGETYTSLTIGKDGTLMFGSTNDLRRLGVFSLQEYYNDNYSGRDNDYSNGHDFSADDGMWWAPREAHYTAWDWVNNVDNIRTSPPQLLKPLGSTALQFGNENSKVLYWSDLGERQFTVRWVDMTMPVESGLLTFEAVLHRSGVIECNYYQLGGNWATGTMFVRDDSTLLAGDLLTEETRSIQFVTNEVSVTVTNMIIGNSVFTEDIVSNVVTTVTNFVDSISMKSIEFRPAHPADVLTYSPVSGTLPVGATAAITLRCDARGMAADDEFATTLAFVHPGGSVKSDVTFTATNAVAPVVTAAVVRSADYDVAMEAMWGSDDQSVYAQLGEDGCTLMWASPEDNYSRVYTIQSCTNLVDGVWNDVASVTNDTSYLIENSSRTNSTSAIYYRAVVQ